MYYVVGAKVKYLREAKGMTLEQVGKLTGLSASYISRIENNKIQAPSFSAIMCIADVLRVDAKEISKKIE